MPNILSLDTASRKTGYAIYKDGSIIAHGTWKLKPQTRFADLFNYITSTIKKYGITQIIAEDIFQDSDARKQVAYQVLCGCRGIIELINQQSKIPVLYITPIKVKVHIWRYNMYNSYHKTLTRDDHKQRMIDCIQNKYGYQLESPKADDEADALGLLITYLESYLSTPVRQTA